MAIHTYTDTLTGQLRRFETTDKVWVQLATPTGELLQELPPEALEALEALEPAETELRGRDSLRLLSQEAVSHLPSTSVGVAGRHVVDEDGDDRIFLDRELLLEVKQPMGDPTEDFAQVGVTMVRDHFDPGVYTVRLPEEETFAQGIDRLFDTGLFRWVVPNEAIRSPRDAARLSPAKQELLTDRLHLPDTVPPPPGAGESPLRLELPSSTPNPDHDILNLPFLWMGIREAWQQVWPEIVPGEGTIVGIVDEAVSSQHNDLRVLPNPSLLAPAPVMALDHHGTEMAGLVAAQRNSFGILGIAPGTGLLSVGADFMQTQGAEVVMSLGNILDALAFAMHWLVRNGHRRVVMNFSWTTKDPNPMLEKRICALADQGYLLVAAAGNNGDDGVNPVSLDKSPRYPAVYREVLTVGAREIAFNGQDKVCGPRLSNSNFGSRVDLAAPGEGFVTTTREGDAFFTTGETSAATASVSGIAALLWSAAPTKTAAEIRQALLETARPPGGEGLGRGCVHALDALNFLRR